MVHHIILYLVIALSIARNPVQLKLRVHSYLLFTTLQLFQIAIIYWHFVLQTLSIVIMETLVINKITISVFILFKLTSPSIITIHKLILSVTHSISILKFTIPVAI